MPFARDVTVDACFVQLASAATVASTFGGLVYKMLILRPYLVVAISVFVISLVRRSMNKTGTMHHGSL